MICNLTKIIDQPPIFRLNVNLIFNSNFKLSIINKRGFRRPEIIIIPPEGMIYYQKSRKKLIRKSKLINPNSLLAIFQTLQKYPQNLIQSIIATISPHKNKDHHQISISNKLFQKLTSIANSQIISHLIYQNFQERHLLILNIRYPSKIGVK